MNSVNGWETPPLALTNSADVVVYARLSGSDPPLGRLSKLITCGCNPHNTLVATRILLYALLSFPVQLG